MRARRDPAFAPGQSVRTERAGDRGVEAGTSATVTAIINRGSRSCPHYRYQITSADGTIDWYSAEGLSAGGGVASEAVKDNVAHVLVYRSKGRTNYGVYPATESYKTARGWESETLRLYVSPEEAIAAARAAWPYADVFEQTQLEGYVRKVAS
jgi:hypothetical protein